MPYQVFQLRLATLQMDHALREIRLARIDYNLVVFCVYNLPMHPFRYKQSNSK